MAEVKIFGIRHHGPGSSRSLIEALNQFEPDCILVEGPPEGDKLLSLAADSDMKPPVALLVYAPEKPRQACYYPFAEFSPEWQAFLYAARKNINCRFMDLPQSHWLALNQSKFDNKNLRPGPEGRLSEEPQSALPTEPAQEFQPGQQEQAVATESNYAATISATEIKNDPIGVLARVAGFSDGERWWEQLVEQRQQGADVFQATLEAMHSLRQELDRELAESREASAKLEVSDDGGQRIVYDDDLVEPLREAYMRQTIRQTSKEFSKIAVVCGAWHGPVLSNMPAAREDSARLKGLPKLKVEATWIPWTHSRLSFASGYGAGVVSPGWYQHIFSHHENPTLSWLVKVAQLLRMEDLDASAAQVIDTLRLVESVAALRDLAHPGLDELNEAIITVLCAGNNLPLKLIEKKLIIGEALGTVPEKTPGTPLEKDLARLQSRLRLKPEAGTRVLELDLRKPLDIERSELLNRLLVLEIDWGEKQYIRGKTSTFHENWDLEWYPELSIRLIEAGIWGRSIEQGAAARAIDLAQKATSLATLVDLMEKVLEANLPEAQGEVMARIKNEAALSGDVVELIKAVPTLARVARYGNVRGTDMAAVTKIIETLVERIAIGLPTACHSLDDEAAQSMQALLGDLNSALLLLNQAQYLSNYREALEKLAHNTKMHGLVSGKATRLLFEARVLADQQTARLMQLALSRAATAKDASHWLEGFLKGSAIVLVHDKKLWQLVDNWVISLGQEAFHEVLPLLRRTFSTFTSPERRQIGERVRDTEPSERTEIFEVIDDAEPELNLERIQKPLQMVRFLLGLTEMEVSATDERRGI